MKQESFKFRLIKARYIYRLLATILGGFFLVFVLVVLDSLFLSKASAFIDSTILFTIVLIFMTLGYYIFKIIQSTRQGKEVVTFTCLEMQSKVYGSINYQNIESFWIDLSFTWLNWDNPAPGLKIRLKNNSLITYDLLSRSDEEAKKEAEIYFNFILHFMNQIKDFGEQDKLSESYFNAMEKLKKAKRRRSNPPTYLYGLCLVIFGLILLLSALIK